MRKRVLRLLPVLILLLGTACHSSDTGALPRAAVPETAVFDSLFQCVTLASPASELHSLMVIRDGKVIYENYDPGHGPEMKHVLWSASKTFTATAIGFAVQEGLLCVDDPVIRFFSPEDLPACPSDTLQSLTVRHLLTMTSGFAHDDVPATESLEEKHSARRQLADTFLFWPGEQFRYNSMNTYLLSAIITRLTGQTVAEYLTPRLFAPLGIRDFYWKASAEGCSMGGWGLFLRTEDLGKMGLWMLRKGNWQGRQLLAESWFDEAMSVQADQTRGKGYSEEEAARLARTSDWSAGYGYQMWRCCNGTFRLDGAWGQWCIICPEKDAVIVVNSVSRNTQGVLRLVWKYVYDKL